VAAHVDDVRLGTAAHRKRGYDERDGGQEGAEDLEGGAQPERVVSAPARIAGTDSEPYATR
jgi:hypothetical protein